jgi:hypothetical protein
MNVYITTYVRKPFKIKNKLAKRWQSEYTWYLHDTVIKNIIVYWALKLFEIQNSSFNFIFQWTAIVKTTFWKF